MSGEDDGACSGKLRTERVVGTIDRPNRTGNDRRYEERTKRKSIPVSWYAGRRRAARATTRRKRPPRSSGRPVPKNETPSLADAKSHPSLSLFSSRSAIAHARQRRSLCLSGATSGLRTRLERPVLDEVVAAKLLALLGLKNRRIRVAHGVFHDESRRGFSSFFLRVCRRRVYEALDTISRVF